MSDHTEIRLETPGGEVICYLAPNFRVEPTLANELFSEPLPNDSAPIVRDNRIIQNEIVVQGVFENSSNLPAAHASALESLFGSSPVSARDQVNRVRSYMNDVGGPFFLFDGTDEYRAMDQATIDRQSGIFPAVAISEFRPPSEGGFSRFEYMIKMKMGVPR